MRGQKLILIIAMGMVLLTIITACSSKQRLNSKEFDNYETYIKYTYDNIKSVKFYEYNSNLEVHYKMDEELSDEDKNKINNTTKGYLILNAKKIDLQKYKGIRLYYKRGNNIDEVYYDLTDDQYYIYQ